MLGNLIVLHGVAGIWDEVACLAIPTTVILGVALAVLREKPPLDDTLGADSAAIDTNEEPATGGRAVHGEPR